MVWGYLDQIERCTYVIFTTSLMTRRSRPIRLRVNKADEIKTGCKRIAQVLASLDCARGCSGAFGRLR